jgi:hypothetical protein
MTSLRQASPGNVRDYWKLVCGIPRPRNPFLDENGENALEGQDPKGEGLLYLSSSNGPGRTRNVQDIPSGRDIFISVNPVEVNPNEAGSTSASLPQIAREDEDSASIAKLTINGQPNDLLNPNYRVSTGVFNVKFPNDPVFRGTPGEFQIAADGYYAVIEGLPTGNNKIVIEAQVDRPFVGFNEPRPWKDKVTYNFRI